MLTRLHIKGLAVIENLTIEFSPQFNVITGETGAGKSILIKALGLLFGKKASPETVRTGFDAAFISGQFELSDNHGALNLLDDLGIFYEKAGGLAQLLIRRKISTSGKSQAWINDVPVTVSFLKKLSEFLIDIFAQHETHKLLDTGSHRYYLDKFLENNITLDLVHNLYQECLEDIKDIRQFVDGFNSKIQDIDYLSFRVNELKQFNPSIEDYREVCNICKNSDNINELRNLLFEAQAYFEENESSSVPLGRAVWNVYDILKKISSPEYQSLAEEARSAANILDDISFTLGKSISNMDIDEKTLEASQERLAGYQDYFRKFSINNDIEKLLKEQSRLEDELEFLSSAQDIIIKKLEGLLKKTNNLKLSCLRLSKERIKASKKIKQLIEFHLHELSMPFAKFEVQLVPILKITTDLDFSNFSSQCVDLFAQISETLQTHSAEGKEKVQFLLSTNKGENLYPLNKIASGGEISRIMLAIKKALASGAETCLLVFDEIDTGISGKTASIVGEKLKQLSESFQVLCISHLAQVAVFADTHFKADKIEVENRTEAKIMYLNKKESADEVARILSGGNITKQSLANAKSLIKQAST